MMRFHASLATSSAPGLGIALIVASGAFFTVADALMKWLRADYPVGEAVGVRGVFSVLIFLAIVPALGGWRTLRVRAWRAQLVRCALVLITTSCFIASLRYLPLANAVGIAFAGPLFTVLLAGPLLGERVGWRRWSAAGIGFAGVLAMVRPGGVDFQIAALLPLATAFFGALRDLLTRHMSVTDHSNATLVVSMLGVLLFGLVTIPLGALAPSQAWLVPPPAHLALFALAGLFMGIGQYCVIESLRVAEAALVSPFKYVSYIWAVACGFLVWGDVPRPATFAGAALVAGSGLYIFWRERQLHRRARAA